MSTEKDSKEKNNEEKVLSEAKELIHNEEAGDYLRTGRSSVNTKLMDVRQHDHGKQELAHKIVHSKKPNDVDEALEVKHEIEHVHEHRTLLGEFTL